MRFLIRFVTRNAAGGTEHRDRIVDAPVITIGRATDRTLHLQDRRARLEHAQLEARNGQVHITTGTLAGVIVNGRSQRDARLVAGDVIEVGANTLRVIEAQEGADFAVTFELRPDARMEDAGRYAADGEGRGPSMRRLSWLLAAAVLLCALILPGLSVVSPRLATLTRESPLLPDDGWWLAGPVHSAHSPVREDCRACHVAPFRRVPDEACLECHTVARHVGNAATPVLGEARCASCHLEHNEPAELVKRHQGLCADCHGDLPGDVALEDAADFLLDHPAFRVSLLRPVRAEEGTTDWETVRLRLDEAAGADRSNLKFDHAAHLDPAGVVAPDGRQVMACIDCHQPEPGGAAMRAIAMDEHCAGCHTLAFDPDDPRRTVPHGDPEGVIQVLVEYYSARLLGSDPDAVEQRLRRPGRALSRAERDRAASEAKVRAMQVAADLFERRACMNCHEVTRRDDADMPWRVEPVRLTRDFFPHAVFSHAAHGTGVTGCDDCHDASASTEALDLLIPGIDDCRSCHGSAVARRNTSAQIPSSCIMCHDFHFEGKGAWP